MYARNRMTKEAIVGTLEKLEGRANVVADSFARREDGSLAFEHAGETEVFWNGQRTATSIGGKTVFVDESGKTLVSDEIELVAEDAGDAGESTLRDSMPLYELMDERTGARRGPFVDLNTAEGQRQDHERIRYAVYCITDDIGAMKDGRPQRDAPEAA